jgi:eukaryotic-like serine/threonine-protein kinase
MSLNPGDIVKGQYQIIRQVGQGGFGVTYLARDHHQPNNADPIILKQIRIPQANENGEFRNADYLNRLQGEAETLWKLKYPYIPGFFARFIVKEYFYLVQEYIKGQDLSQEIIAGEPIDEQQAVAILQEILLILQFVHSNNIIHRDIKPANIIRRDSDKKLFLIDFGAVKEDATKHTNASGIYLTQAIFTPGYAPAEQLAGMPRLNSDIYAVGIMMMQAVTGFSIQAICNSNSIPRRDPENKCRFVWESHAAHISPKLRQIISKMIEYDFGDRYQFVEEVLGNLEALNNSATEPESEESENSETTVNSEPDNSKNTILSSIIDFCSQKWLKFLALIIIACIAVIIISTPTQVCSLKVADNMSCGEEVLDPLSKGSIKLKAAENYQQKNYQDAFTYYQESWQTERLDAEILIYLNNALLETKKIDYYTIAVAVPIKTSQENEIKNSEISQDFLRGIAQAQTEVNLSLSSLNQVNAQQLPGQNILHPRSINSKNTKGLKIIIVDDSNKIAQAQKVAQAIAKQGRILGIVGHYTSKMTLATVDIYEEEKLAQISYGTTSTELTQNPKDNFFRVVYTINEEAEALVKYLEQTDYQNKKIAIFYNPNTDYSNRLKITIKDKLQKLKNSNIQVVKEFNLADEVNFSTHLALQEAEKLGANIFLLLPDGQETNSLAKAIEILETDNGNNIMLGGNPLFNSKVINNQATQPLNLVVATFWYPSTNSKSKSEFQQQTKQLWGTNVNGRTAMGYDATLTLIEAIKRQTNPTRKGTIEQLRESNFSVSKAATGEIAFNAPKNGDRLNFYPTLVRLVNCGDSDSFVHLSIDDSEASSLACKEE